jgi:deoxyribonuclease-4
MQVFVKNNNQWKGKALDVDDIRNYKTAQAKSTIAPVLAHAAYLINLGAVSARILQKSRDAFVDELTRCELLGISGLNVHPGSHGGAGETEGMKRIAESIDIAHERTAAYRTRTILEATAGQGTALGYRFEQLQQIIELVEQKERMGVCLDTCHLLAAGYDIRTAGGWNDTMKDFHDVIGLGRLVMIHMNDSKKEFNSHVDRHEHIGKGFVGLEGFRAIMNDARVADIPKILETPKSEDMHEDVENLGVLRSLVDGERMLNSEL